MSDQRAYAINNFFFTMEANPYDNQGSHTTPARPLNPTNPHTPTNQQFQSNRTPSATADNTYLQYAPQWSTLNLANGPYSPIPSSSYDLTCHSGAYPMSSAPIAMPPITKASLPFQHPIPLAISSPRPRPQDTTIPQYQGPAPLHNIYGIPCLSVAHPTQPQNIMRSQNAQVNRRNMFGSQTGNVYQGLPYTQPVPRPAQTYPSNNLQRQPYRHPNLALALEPGQRSDFSSHPRVDTQNYPNTLQYQISPLINSPFFGAQKVSPSTQNSQQSSVRSRQSMTPTAKHDVDKQEHYNVLQQQIGSLMDISFLKPQYESPYSQPSQQPRVQFRQTATSAATHHLDHRKYQDTLQHPVQPLTNNAFFGTQQGSPPSRWLQQSRVQSSQATTPVPTYATHASAVHKLSSNTPHGGARSRQMSIQQLSAMSPGLWQFRDPLNHHATPNMAQGACTNVPQRVLNHAPDGRANFQQTSCPQPLSRPQNPPAFLLERPKNRDIQSPLMNSNKPFDNSRKEMNPDIRASELQSVRSEDRSTPKAHQSGQSVPMGTARDATAPRPAPAISRAPPIPRQRQASSRPSAQSLRNIPRLPPASSDSPRKPASKDEPAVSIPASNPESPASFEERLKAMPLEELEIIMDEALKEHLRNEEIKLSTAPRKRSLSEEDAVAQQPHLKSSRTAVDKRVPAGYSLWEYQRRQISAGPKGGMIWELYTCSDGKDRLVPVCQLPQDRYDWKSGKWDVPEWKDTPPTYEFGYVAYLP